MPSCCTSVVIDDQMQVKYLNQALSRFSSTLVIPVNFVMFTTSSLVASAILYRDFEHMSTSGTALSLIGIAIMFGGVYLITLVKEEMLLEDTVVTLVIDEELATASPLLSVSSLSPEKIQRAQHIRRHHSMYVSAAGPRVFEFGSPVLSHRTATIHTNTLATDSEYSCSS